MTFYPNEVSKTWIYWSRYFDTGTQNRGKQSLEKYAAQKANFTTVWTGTSFKWALFLSWAWPCHAGMGEESGSTGTEGQPRTRRDRPRESANGMQTLRFLLFFFVTNFYLYDHRNTFWTLFRLDNSAFNDMTRQPLKLGNRTSKEQLKFWTFFTRYEHGKASCSSRIYTLKNLA